MDESRFEKTIILGVTIKPYSVRLPKNFEFPSVNGFYETASGSAADYHGLPAWSKMISIIGQTGGDRLYIGFGNDGHIYRSIGADFVLVV